MNRLLAVALLVLLGLALAVPEPAASQTCGFVVNSCKKGK